MLAMLTFPLIAGLLDNNPAFCLLDNKIALSLPIDFGFYDNIHSYKHFGKELKGFRLKLLLIRSVLQGKKINRKHRYRLLSYIVLS